MQHCKKILQLFFFIAVFILGKSSTLPAQTTWSFLQNSPYTPDRFDDIYFISDSTGWAVNTQGKIYKTTDAGNSWNLQYHANVYFRSVEFLNKDTGFAGTLNGKFLRTHD